jgi:hypothetical protein
MAMPDQRKKINVHAESEPNLLLDIKGEGIFSGSIKVIHFEDWGLFQECSS